MTKSISIKFVLFLFIAILAIGSFIFLGKEKAGSPSLGKKANVIEVDTGTKTEITKETGDEMAFLGAGAHITVHIEPTDDKSYAVEKWTTLQKIVNLADAYGMKLSLHFSPQMASFILDDKSKLEMVRVWERNGHEIGMHHHGLSHVNWDGYTDEKVGRRKSGYKGSINDMMSIIEQLSANGTILVGSGVDEQTDWPEGVVYATRGGSPPSAKDILGRVEEENWNGNNVNVLTKAPFGVDQVKNNLTVDDIENALKQAGKDDYIGIVITDNTMSPSDLNELEKVFRLFIEYGVRTQTVESLLSG